MQVCKGYQNEEHEEITHETSYCPLCVELERTKVLRTAKDELHKKLIKLHEEHLELYKLLSLEGQDTFRKVLIHNGMKNINAGKVTINVPAAQELKKELEIEEPFKLGDEL